jgi:hypothetical protein
MVELYMLKQDKNRKYNCPVQLAVYGQTVEGTIYLTPLKRHIISLPVVIHVDPERTSILFVEGEGFLDINATMVYEDLVPLSSGGGGSRMVDTISRGG